MGFGRGSFQQLASIRGFGHNLEMAYQIFFVLSTVSLIEDVYILRLVITKGYGVRATTIEGQNSFSRSSKQKCKFHVTDGHGQNTRDQITSDRRSKLT